MTPDQLSALEALAGRALTQLEIDQIGPLLAIRDDAAIAAALPPRAIVVAHMVSERGIRTLPVLPRHRHALLLALKAAAEAEPAWLAPVLAAAGVPEEDRPALADDLQCAYGWLKQDAGLDLGSAGVRSMLDVIAVGVPDAAPACAAAKALAQRTEAPSIHAVSAALNGVA